MSAYTVIRHGDRWLVVRLVPGTDTHTVVADCRTESAARTLAAELTEGARDASV